MQVIIISFSERHKFNDQKGGEKMIRKITCFAISLAMMFTMCAVDVSATVAEPENTTETQQLQGETPTTTELEAVVESADDISGGIEITGITVGDVDDQGKCTIELKWKSTLQKETDNPEVFEYPRSEDFSVSLNGDEPENTLLNGQDGVFSATFSVEYDKAKVNKFGVKAGTEWNSEDTYYAIPQVTFLTPHDAAAIAGSQCVLLNWNEIEGVDGYCVKAYRNGSLISTKYTTEPSMNVTGLNAYTISSPSSSIGYYSYKFNVAGYVLDNNEKVLGKESSISEDPIRPMLITYKAKAKQKITRAGKKVYTLKKGQTFTSVAFQGGRVKPEINGNRCSFPLIYTKSASAKYVTAWNYTKAEKEKYVNDRGLTSGTAYLVWVSQYTQQVTIFTKQNGKWTQYACWETSTGKAKTPSVVGDFKVHKKIKKRHGIPYWTAFYSTMSIHTKPSMKSAKKLGTPKSGGCVRVEKANAAWAYPNLKKGTKVVVY